MRKLACHIQKGGVGKTTTSGNIGYCLSNQKKKTVLIDCDPQGNLSSWLLTVAPKFELADVLMKTTDLKNAVVSVNEYLSIIPTIAIGGVLKTFAETKLMYDPLAFSRLAKGLADMGFEYAIFDLSPGMSLLEKSIIGIVDEVVTPLEAEYFSYDGIEIFSHELKTIQENMSRPILHKRIVLNKINLSFSQHKMRLEELKKNSPEYTVYTIAQDRNIADAQALNKTVFQHAPDSKTITEYIRLTNDLIKSI